MRNNLHPEKILVSACLLGEKVRYDGNNLLVENPVLLQWIKQRRVISFCPEVAAGLPTPRIAAEISGGDGNSVLAGEAHVIDKSGEDVTQLFITGAKLALSLCQQWGIEVAILARRSPSCGDQTIYNRKFSATLIQGTGVTAALLSQNGIRVFNQTTINDALMYTEKPG